MTPEFSQHVDPIFMRVFALLDWIERGEQPSAQEQQAILHDEIIQAQSGLQQSGSGAWDLAKYALVAWIDEMLANATNWSGRDWWCKHFLERKYFRSEQAHEEFFAKAKKAVDLPAGNDALETYYVCVMLGFRGLYRSDRNSPHAESRELALKTYGLPATLETWARETGNVIRERRRDRSSTGKDAARERSIVPAEPLWGRTRLLWPWLLTLLLLGLNVVYCYQRL